MKYITFIIFLIIQNVCVFAQSTDSISNVSKEVVAKQTPSQNSDPQYTVIDSAEGKVYMRVEKTPEFPGGTTALMQFIGSNVIYPADAVKHGFEGKVVVKFVVNTTGKVKSPHVVKSSGYESLDQAAIDVINKIPDFKPGEQAGKKVSVYYIVPIDFRLSADKSKKE